MAEDPVDWVEERLDGDVPESQIRNYLRRQGFREPVIERIMNEAEHRRAGPSIPSVSTKTLVIGGLVAVFAVVVGVAAVFTVLNGGGGSDATEGDGADRPAAVSVQELEQRVGPAAQASVRLRYEIRHADDDGLLGRATVFRHNGSQQLRLEGMIVEMVAGSAQDGPVSRYTGDGGPVVCEGAAGNGSGPRCITADAERFPRYERYRGLDRVFLADATPFLNATAAVRVTGGDVRTIAGNRCYAYEAVFPARLLLGDGRDGAGLARFCVDAGSGMNLLFGTNLTWNGYGPWTARATVVGDGMTALNAAELRPPIPVVVSAHCGVDPAELRVTPIRDIPSVTVAYRAVNYTRTAVEGETIAFEVPDLAAGRTATVFAGGRRLVQQCPAADG